MAGKKILITGATGFIGRHLMHVLMQHPEYEIALLVRDTAKAAKFFGEKPTYIPCGSDDFKEAVMRFAPEIVVHLAAYSTSQDDRENIKALIDSNILFTSLLLDALKEHPPKLFINTGSFSEYFNNDGRIDPAYLYAATKTSARHIIDYFAKSYGFGVVHAILYTVYGEAEKNRKLFDYVADALDAKEPVDMTPGEQSLDFIHIDDVVAFYRAAIAQSSELSAQNLLVHVGSGKGTTPRELAAMMEKLEQKQANIAWGGRSYRHRDIMKAVADTATCAPLKWRAKITLEEGIRSYFARKASGEK